LILFLIECLKRHYFDFWFRRGVPNIRPILSAETTFGRTLLDANVAISRLSLIPDFFFLIYNFSRTPTVDKKLLNQISTFIDHAHPESCSAAVTGLVIAKLPPLETTVRMDQYVNGRIRFILITRDSCFSCSMLKVPEKHNNICCF
jgi:hypothetical protein